MHASAPKTLQSAQSLMKSCRITEIEELRLAHMTNQIANRWRTADRKPSTYWLTGTVLIWLTLPASIIDILLAPQWFAPHWQCDSLGIPIMWLRRLALPFAVMSAAIAVLITALATWNRVGGTDIFAQHAGGAVRRWTVTILTAVLIAPLIYHLGIYMTEVLFIRTWTENCAGRAEDIVVTLRRPIVQVLPLVEALLILWLLHMRAYALSAKRTPKAV